MKQKQISVDVYLSLQIRRAVTQRGQGQMLYMSPHLLLLPYEQRKKHINYLKNIILNKGELGIEFIANDKSPKIKIGNGRYSWDKLPYFDINLPEKYTWGELRGTTLENEATYTKNWAMEK